MFDGKNTHILYWVTALLVVSLLLSQLDIRNFKKNGSQTSPGFTEIVVNVNATPVAGLILVFLYCCRHLIDGILNHDTEKLLLWLIGSAMFNIFLVLDVLRGDLTFGSVTAAVLILVWTSVLVLYFEFRKDGKSSIDKKNPTGLNAKTESGVEAVDV